MVDHTRLSLAQSAALSPGPAPLVVRACTAAVEAAVEVEGLYRREGAAQSRARLARTLAEGGDAADLSGDVHAVGSLLKRYLRANPLPPAVYDACVAAAALSVGASQPDAVRAARLGGELAKLSAPHLDTLRFMVRHLHRVVAHAGRNKMTAQNVAVVFGPTLLGRGEGEGGAMDELKRMPEQVRLMQFLLVNRAAIFAEPAERARFCAPPPPIFAELTGDDELPPPPPESPGLEAALREPYSRRRPSRTLIAGGRALLLIGPETMV